MQSANFDHLKKPLNATVFRYQGNVRVGKLMLVGNIWLSNKTETGEVSIGDPTIKDLAGFHGKRVRITMVVEEIEEEEG